VVVEKAGRSAEVRIAPPKRRVVGLKVIKRGKRKRKDHMRQRGGRRVRKVSGIGNSGDPKKEDLEKCRARE
jgi:hypothetical protein